MTLEITDLINQTTNERQVEILLRCRELNKFAYLFMKQPRMSWKAKYRLLQKTKEWKEGRLLLREYFELSGPLYCIYCKKLIGDKFTLHHEEEYYNSVNLFHPNYVQIIHNQCHKKVHNK